ncbi:MAG TPA: SUF system NifU family Fe-S cluster assembly protein [Kiritimatiellia bacterium]|nr:SUF system NifU family Fe-S cluster assembly protein [Kiritimatiellia bacterium]HRZ12213.1 SUF system NifU family Fe-S cluster assembly protein [Kiritimatiellia bacterium]HSA18029.1 SUF system NifU family Fe-S cluster assembly protein [Kiritimatiellia bacterium]
MELDELYQDILLDHFKHPRNYGPLPEPEVLVDELNPTCGDHIRLTARLENGRVADVRFDGQGCAISLASASMMSELMRGLTPDEARARAADFVAFMRGEKDLDPDTLGDLAALAGVRQFPLRIKCATMSWHALEKALGKLGG